MIRHAHCSKLLAGSWWAIARTVRLTFFRDEKIGGSREGEGAQRVNFSPNMTVGNILTNHCWAPSSLLSDTQAHAFPIEQRTAQQGAPLIWTVVEQSKLELNNYIVEILLSAFSLCYLYHLNRCSDASNNLCRHGFEEPPNSTNMMAPFPFEFFVYIDCGLSINFNN